MPQALQTLPLLQKNNGPSQGVLQERKSMCIALFIWFAVQKQKLAILPVIFTKRLTWPSVKDTRK